MSSMYFFIQWVSTSCSVYVLFFVDCNAVKKHLCEWRIINITEKFTVLQGELYFTWYFTEMHWTCKVVVIQAERQTDLKVAAEAIAFQVPVFVLVEFHFVLFGDGVPHHDTALGHQLGKLIRADIGRQTWGGRWKGWRLEHESDRVNRVSCSIFEGTNLIRRHLCFCPLQYQTILQLQGKNFF